MAITQVDAKAALILIDLQKGIVGLPLAHPGAEVVGRASELAKAFRAAGLPVVLVNVIGRAPGRVEAGFGNFTPPADWAEFVPEIGPVDGDIVISKQRVGAFLGTALDETLRGLGVTQVFFAGIATSGGVEASGRSAHDLGYSVVFVTDAMTDRDEEVHRFCIQKMFPRMGETGATEEVLQMLKEGGGR